MGTSLFVVLACMSLGIGVVIYIIAADRLRFLARFDLDQWRENYYLRALPNFLQTLHDNHFTSPFPRAKNAVATAYFQFRVAQLTRKRSRTFRRVFMQQHIILFGLLEVLRPYLHDFILNERQKIIGERVITMEDTLDRDRLISFLDSARSYRATFLGALNDYDRKILLAMVDRKLISTLRRAHAIFQEHGYSLLPEFTQLREWQEMTGSELAHDLPKLPVWRERDLVSGMPAPR